LAASLLALAPTAAEHRVQFSQTVASESADLFLRRRQLRHPLSSDLVPGEDGGEVSEVQSVEEGQDGREGREQEMDFLVFFAGEAQILGLIDPHFQKMCPNKIQILKNHQK